MRRRRPERPGQGGGFWKGGRSPLLPFSSVDGRQEAAGQLPERREGADAGIVVARDHVVQAEAEHRVQDQRHEHLPGDEQADAACRRCGRSFCSQHGGNRLCWRPLYPLSSARWSLARRPLCDVCTPSSAWMGISIGLAVCLALVGGLMAFLFLFALRR